MEENQYVTSYKEVSQELGKKLIKLYGAKIFPRQGKVFADKLFQSGIEAGSYLAALADIEERAVKINLATNAMIQLNQTEYLVNVMLEAGYYSPVQVVEIQDYLDGLTRAMKDLLITAYAQMHAESLRPVVASAPLQTMPKPAKPKPEKPTPAATVVNAAQPAPQPLPAEFDTDPDGFNAPVTNK
ncbi:MAG: hypothetical protein K2K39_02220 [Clostridia bacterium]|nr:hypothetical protein [Clostridia bacterium]